MYFTFECPKCGKNLKFREEIAGRKCGCPYCKSTIVVPSPPQREEEPQPPPVSEGMPDLKRTSIADARRKPKARRKTTEPTTSGGGKWSSGTDVSMILSGLIGLVLSAAFLALMVPLYNYYPGELFLQRGWVPYVLVFFMGWALAILFLKSRKLARQKASMLFDLLPNDLGDEITAESADKFTRHIRGLPVESGSSFLINRVLRGLEHFRVRKSNPEVADMLASQSEIDATAVESSYTILKVFIWAIPILGFIGTVIGISHAVGGFSGKLEGAEDITVLKDSLNDVTSGLATAFDTTLIALVMSILVMFPTSGMQKAEEDLLNWVDEYCNENLLKRLDDGGGGPETPGGGTTRADIQRAVNSAMAPHHDELHAWAKKLEVIGSALTGQVTEGWRAINEQVLAQQEGHVAHADRVRRTAQELHQTVADLGEQAQRLRQEMADSGDESTAALQARLAEVERELATLAGELSQAGQTGTQRRESRRRWRWFSGKQDREE